MLIFERLFDPHCGVPYLKALTHPLRRAWLLCAVEPTLWDPVCKSCALPLCTDYILGRLWPHGIRCSFSGSLERDREKKNYFWVEDLTWDSLVVELPPHVHLGGAITDLSRTSGIPSWKRGLLHMDNINFVDVIWFDTLALSCMLYHASNLLYPLLYLKIKKGRAFIRENPIEKKIILEAMPLLIFG